MLDYHVHPGISIDADDFTIFEYCRRALQIGLKEICFTPHYEFDPQRAGFDWFVRVDQDIRPMNGPWLDDYFKDLTSAQKYFAPKGLFVKAGVEIGFDHGLEKNIEAIVSQYPFDYVLGSVHCVDHVAISSSRESDSYYPGTTLRHVISNYYSVLSEAVQSGLFDAVGHLDVYRRHGLRHFGEKIWQAYEPYIEDILVLMKKNNLIFEINTSSLRHGQKDFYHSRPILEKARLMGFEEVTVGSDAHRLQELGSGIGQAMEMLAGLDFTPVTFTKRERRKLSIRNGNYGEKGDS